MTAPVKIYYVNPKIFQRPVRKKQHTEKPITALQHSVLWFLRKWDERGVSASEIGLRLCGGGYEKSASWANGKLRSLIQKGYVQKNLLVHRPYAGQNNISKNAHYRLTDKGKEYIRKNPYPEIEPLRN